ncbi:hypothetical protein CDD83_2618 [Cordyceps sp. RAO-2017]|nr:hypothetical protein CDD83_2618 [Cordyceps sp. RAO-2017]
MAKMLLSPMALRAVTATAIFITLFYLVARRHSPGLAALQEAVAQRTQRATIPNYVHHVFILEDPEADFPFEFADFLSAYSGWLHLRPDKIFLHTNANERQIGRARDGSAGKWTKLLFGLPRLVVSPVVMPTHAANGLELNHVAHKSDMVRARVVRDHGGMYIDFDVIVLRDMAALRRTGFAAVTGREIRHEVNSGTFMSRRRSRFISEWAERMPQVYDGGWLTHSNMLMTTIANRLVAEPGQMLILERDAMAPGDWDNQPAINKDLFGARDDAPDHIRDLRPGAALPPVRDDAADARPSWAWDLNTSYLLHAFPLEMLDFKISPRYVLERRSNYARAAYPIVKDMYERGHVTYKDITS